MSGHALVGFRSHDRDDMGHLYPLCACGWKVLAADEDDAREAHAEHVDRETTGHAMLRGRQSDIGARFDLIDPVAIRALARVLHEGAQVYGEGSENWRAIPVRDHLNHAVAHVYRSLEGDESEDHLPHALCRLMFAVGLSEDDTVEP